MHHSILISGFLFVCNICSSTFVPGVGGRPHRQEGSLARGQAGLAVTKFTECYDCCSQTEWHRKRMAGGHQFSIPPRRKATPLVLYVRMSYSQCINWFEFHAVMKLVLERFIWSVSPTDGCTQQINLWFSSSFVILHIFFCLAFQSVIWWSPFIILDWVVMFLHVWT